MATRWRIFRFGVPGKSPNREFLAVTAADGSFFFDTLPEDAYTLTCSVDGYVEKSLPNIGIVLGQTRSDAKLETCSGRGD
jgi:hypothetical protein